MDRNFCVKSAVIWVAFQTFAPGLGPYCYKGNGQWYLSAGVSKKSVQRLKAKVANLLAPGNHDPWLDVRDALNAFLFGWARYFSYGTHRAAFRGIDYYVYERVRDFLARRHKMKGRGRRADDSGCVGKRAYFGDC
jgi:RNA-directed DNA polymerase